MDPDEGLLHQVLGALAIADHAVDEVEQPDPIAVHDLAEGPGIAVEVADDEIGDL